MEETASAAIVAIHQRDDHINPGLTSFLSPSKTLTSLRRALLPDMSSRNRLPPRVPDHLPCIKDLIVPDVDDEEEEEEKRLGFEIGHSIQEDKMTMKKKEMEDRDQWPGEFDIWRSIMSQNRSQWSESETTLPPPYVHPLVRRSSSCLSDKSLEICTENLGSESGSDCFSSFPLPGMGESDYEKDGKNEGFFPAAFCRADVDQDFDDKLSFHARPRNKERPRSFPPPLPSLSSAADGTSVQMRSRRENGRLVLEAVSFPYQKNFHSLRENGRLMLMFTATDVDRCDCDYIYDPSTAEREETDEVDCGDGEGIDWIIGEKVETRVEIVASSPNIDYIGNFEIPKIAMLMKKPDKVRELVFFEGIDDGGEVMIDHLPIKLNPLNVYEYFLRTITSATTASAVTDPSETTHPPSPNTKKDHLISRNDSDLGWSDQQREVQVLLKDYTKSMEDCWVSVMKDSGRRSLFFPGATLHCHVMT